MMKDRTLLRRIGAMAMAFVLSMSLLSTPAFAAGDAEPVTRTLTVQNAIDGASYKLYPVMTLEEIEDDVNEGEYLYKYAVTPGAKAAVKAMATDNAYKFQEKAGDGYDAGLKISAGFTYDDVNDIVAFVVKPDDDSEYEDAKTAYAAWQKGKVGLAFASAFAEDLRDAVTAIDPSIAIEPTVTEDGTVTFPGQPEGYYLLVSDAKNTKAMTFSLPGSKDPWTVVEKNSKPTAQKYVYEETTDEWVKKNDIAVGDTVMFRAVIDAGAGLNLLTFKDTLGDGLTFNELHSIRFYPRNSKGQNVTVSSDGVALGDKTAMREVYLKSIPADDGTSFKDDEDGYFTGYVPMIDDTDLYATGEDGSRTKIVADGMAADVFKDHNLFDQIYVNGQDFTVKFSDEWLGSKRAVNENADAAKSAYTDLPMSSGDKRLEKYGKDEADKYAMYNQYIGDPATTTDDGGLIVIEYDAIVNEDATIGGTGNENKIVVEYSPKPDDPTPEKTTESKTHTYVYELDVLKYVAGDDTVALEGATFNMYRAESVVDGETFVKEIGKADSGITYADGKVTVSGDVIAALKAETEKAEADQKPMTFLPMKDENTVAGEGDAIAFYKAKSSTMTDDEKAACVADLTSGADGKIRVTGLDSTAYAMKETVAPTGYILADEPVYFVIGSVASGSATLADGATTRNETAGTVDMNTYVLPNTWKSGDAYEFEPAATKLTVGGNSNVEQVKIANASGVKLPDTGGIGTTVFYAGGAVLVLGACVLLVAKKRAGRTGD